MKDSTFFHVSEFPGIERFEPRLPVRRVEGVARPIVWAIDEKRLVNYLLPRDCPRVAFNVKKGCLKEDVERVYGCSTTGHVVAIEKSWERRVRNAVVWVYHLPSEIFRLVDSEAGYYVSEETVEPIRRVRIDDVVGELAIRGVELLICDSLWPLHDEVVNSSLQYSCIRMRNASHR
ncbi:hypothetical protein VDG1235_668 [Verrucomicrobiia bacterium DG1235]|nr:hypothetical protein VDG1235_668 [Verrucomicrobiae bacterium DG1235]